jgi:hypothetical protein
MIRLDAPPAAGHPLLLHFSPAGEVGAEGDVERRRAASREGFEAH